MTEVRDHLSERITASRLKLEAKRSTRNSVFIVLAALVSVLGAGWILANVAPSLVKSTNAVAFRVDNARAVKPGLNEIRIKGIPAGRITSVELQDGKPVVKAELDKDFGKVYRDAKAELRPNSALEDQFIDVIDRGTPAAGEATGDEPLAPSQTETPVSIDDVFSTFNGDVRTRLRVLLADLGQGLDDGGAQLGQALAEAAPLIREAGRLTEQLARRKPMTERLVHNTGVLTAELARRDQELRALVRNGSATLGTLAASGADLDATLREIPPTMRSIDTSFSATRAVLGDVDGAVRALAPVASRLGATLGSVRALSADADPAVRALQTPIKRLVPLTRALQPVSADLASAIAKLRPQVDTIDRATVDLVKCETGVKGFFQWDASMTKYGDSRGQAPRGNFNAGAQTFQLANPEERAYAGCVPGAPIGARPPAPAQDGR